VSRLVSGLRLLSPLAYRDFRRLYSGLCVSLFGDGVLLVALAWQVYALWDAPTAMAIVGIAMTLPHVAFLLVGGAVSDRFDRRRVMVVSDVVRALAIGAVAVLSSTGGLELWHVIALVAVYGAATAFFGPAFDALTPSLLPSRELPRANALDQLIRPLALRLAGPAAGGLIVAGAGLPAAFAVDAATFVVSAFAVLAIRRALDSPQSASLNLAGDIRDGLRYVRSRTWLWGTLGAAAIAYLLFMGPSEVLLTYIVKQDLGGSAADLGLVFAAGGVGSVLCALVLGQTGLPRRDITFMYVAWTAATFAVAGYGLASSIALMMAASFAFNALETAGVIVWATAKQRHVPGALLGRVSSLDWMISTGLLPLSFALTGPVSAAVGARATLVGAAVLGGIVTLAALFLPGMRSIEGRTGGPEASYDRTADVVHLRLGDGHPDRAVQRAWGAMEVDAAGRPVAARYIAASRRMPAQFLARLPEHSAVS
jgi:DHA3 family tetracycline resistance protein-like MFS transporter